MSPLPGAPTEARAEVQGPAGRGAAPAALGPRGRPAPTPPPPLARSTCGAPPAGHARPPPRDAGAVTCDTCCRVPSVGRNAAAAEPAALARGSSTGPAAPLPSLAAAAPPPAPDSPGSLRARGLLAPLPPLLIGRSARPRRALIGWPGAGAVGRAGRRLDLLPVSPAPLLRVPAAPPGGDPDTKPGSCPSALGCGETG
ncbi:uncharacterized protein LOC131999455 [Mustela nigripes]|uniref:uncharacterized protein LOC131999455 n=1 Tax=Mustela nigripes TaxID=77151 RepID=UPI002816582C|nr:uncharacterized protein LOC131999455 [Mustela nigripes]